MNKQSKIQLVKSTILKHGLIWSFAQLCWWVIKQIWYLLVIRKDRVLDDVDAKRWIFEQWKKEWNPDEEDSFFRLFEYDYEYTCKKIKINKKNNFRIKFICILPFLIATVLFVGGISVYNIHMFIQSKSFSDFLKSNNWNFSLFNTALYAVAIVLTVVISKWVDVKKYQETWSRHSAHKYAIDMEMFKFIMRMDDYSHIDRKKYFAINIMKTWDINQNKFIKNMKKESKMDDILDKVKIKTE